MDSQLDGSYIVKFDDGDLTYDFDGDEFGTDFINSPLDLSSLNRILSLYENIPSSCNGQDPLTYSNVSTRAEHNKHETKSEIASDATQEENQSDILSSAFSFAMQCSPASSLASEDSLDSAPISSQEPKSPSMDIPQSFELQMMSPENSMDKQSMFDASSPDSGISDMDCSPEIMLQEEPEVEIVYRKPNATYLELVARAIMSTSKEQAALQEIYEYIMNKYPYFRTAKPAWKVSVRHNLSTNECFVKKGRVQCNRGYYWGIHPLCREEFLKQNFSSSSIRKRIKAAMSTSDNAAKSHQSSTKGATNLPTSHEKSSLVSKSNVTISRVPMNIVYRCEQTQKGTDNGNTPVPKYYKQQVFVQTAPMSHDVRRQQQYHVGHSHALNPPQSFAIPQHFYSKQRSHPNIITVRNCNYITS